MIKHIPHREIPMDEMGKKSREGFCQRNTEKPFVMPERGESAIANANRS